MAIDKAGAGERMIHIKDKVGNICGVAFFLGIVMLLIAPSRAICDTHPTFLILNSYHKEFKWTDAQVEAAKKVLIDAFPNAEIVVEYMDTKRIYSKVYLDALYHLYDLKYKKVAFDAIVTTDDNALWFALEHRKKLFKNAPISFCGINDYKASAIKASPRVAGIIEVLDIAATVDLILQIHPGTERIAVVVDSTPTGIGQIAEVKKAAEGYRNVTFEYLEGKNLSHEELLEKLRSLPDDAVVLLTVWLRDKNDTFMSSEEGGRLISKSSSVPVYGIIDMYFGDGIVGGKLLNSSTHGRIAAEKAIQFIKNKEPPNADAVTISSMNTYMFDHEQLIRWNIDVSRLPSGSTIINEPFSFYEEYKYLVIGAAVVVSLLALIITLLIANILHRRKAEAALKSSEEKYKLLADNAKDVIWVRDMDMNLIYVSPSVEKVRGYTPEEAMQQELAEVLTPDAAEKAMHLYLELIAPENAPALIKDSLNIELDHICKDGSTICMDCNLSLMKDDDGKPVGILGVSRDITDKKRAVEALKKSEEKFRSLYNLSPQAIALSEIHTGKLVDVNDRLCELTGYQKSDLIGRTTTEIGFYSEEDRSIFLQELAAHGCVNGLEMDFTASNGAALTALMYSRPIQFHNAEYLLTIFNDITQQKRLEEHIQQAQRIESIGNLAGGIAHDFNNILFPIVGMSEMLLEDLPAGSPERENAEEIFKAGKRGSDIVKQILAFSRQSDHKMVPTRVQPVLKEVLKLSRSTIPAYIDIQQQIQPDCGMIMADPTQIHQVAMNIITNAYHAMADKGGRLTVRLKQVELMDADGAEKNLAPGKYALLSVSDTGHGISNECINKIFEPYFTTKEKGKGTGIGLAVVYGIVKEHKGGLEVHSEIGRGSIFDVYLPLLDRSQETQSARQAEDCTGGNERILLVDDEEPIAKLEKQMLERLGYNVSIRFSSPDALEAFKINADQFNLVISDMSMPSMSGDRLARELIAIRPDIPIIICTGFSEKLNQEKAAAIGVKGFLMKPIVKAEMAKMVRKVLDGSKRNDQQ